MCCDSEVKMKRESLFEAAASILLSPRIEHMIWVAPWFPWLYFVWYVATIEERGVLKAFSPEVL